VITVHIEAARRVRRQSGIVVRFLKQVFGAATLVVKPDHEVDGLAEVGHEDSILVPAGLEQLVLLGVFRLHFRACFLIAQATNRYALPHPSG